MKLSYVVAVSLCFLVACTGKQVVTQKEILEQTGSDLEDINVEIYQSASGKSFVEFVAQGIKYNLQRGDGRIFAVLCIDRECYVLSESYTNEPEPFCKAQNQHYFVYFDIAPQDNNFFGLGKSNCPNSVIEKYTLK